MREERLRKGLLKNKIKRKYDTIKIQNSNPVQR